MHNIKSMHSILTKKKKSNATLTDFINHSRPIQLINAPKYDYLFDKIGKNVI